MRLNLMQRFTDMPALVQLYSVALLLPLILLFGMLLIWAPLCALYLSIMWMPDYDVVISKINEVIGPFISFLPTLVCFAILPTILFLGTLFKNRFMWVYSKRFALVAGFVATASAVYSFFFVLSELSGLSNGSSNRETFIDQLIGGLLILLFLLVIFILLVIALLCLLLIPYFILRSEAFQRYFQVICPVCDSKKFGGRDVFFKKLECRKCNSKWENYKTSYEKGWHSHVPIE